MLNIKNGIIIDGKVYELRKGVRCNKGCALEKLCGDHNMESEAMESICNIIHGATDEDNMAYVEVQPEDFVFLCVREKESNIYNRIATAYHNLEDAIQYIENNRQGEGEPMGLIKQRVYNFL